MRSFTSKTLIIIEPCIGGLVLLNILTDPFYSSDTQERRSKLTPKLYSPLIMCGSLLNVVKHLSTISHNKLTIIIFTNVF